MSRGRKLAASIRAVAICVFATVVLAGMAGYVGVVSSVVARGVDVPRTEYDVYLSLGSYLPGENMVVDVCYFVVTTAFVLTGCFGFLIWARMVARDRNRGGVS
jgi:hypothetical protein